jgi:hypothetical protein
MCTKKKRTNISSGVKIKVKSLRKAEEESLYKKCIFSHHHENVGREHGTDGGAAHAQVLEAEEHHRDLQQRGGRFCERTQETFLTYYLFLN